MVDFSMTVADIMIKQNKLWFPVVLWHNASGVSINFVVFSLLMTKVAPSGNAPIGGIIKKVKLKYAAAKRKVKTIEDITTILSFIGSFRSWTHVIFSIKYIGWTA